MDEQEATENFEELCGSKMKAGMLFDIYKNSYPYKSWSIGGQDRTRAEVFTSRALNQGFTIAQVNALLSLQ